MKKDELMRECVQIMKAQKLESWYNENMLREPQENTLSTLERAIMDDELTVKEALVISFIVGFQWLEKFEED